MTKPGALRILAGPRARRRLRETGLMPDDVRVVPAAAGGPKGLVLNPLDRYLFAQWLPRSSQTVHLIGASIGAWRMASACLPDADAALARISIGTDYRAASAADHAIEAVPNVKELQVEIFGRLD